MLWSTSPPSPGKRVPQFSLAVPRSPVSTCSCPLACGSFSDSSIASFPSVWSRKWPDRIALCLLHGLGWLALAVTLATELQKFLPFLLPWFCFVRHWAFFAYSLQLAFGGTLISFLWSASPSRVTLCFICLRQFWLIPIVPASLLLVSTSSFKRFMIGKVKFVSVSKLEALMFTGSRAACGSPWRTCTGLRGVRSPV